MLHSDKTWTEEYDELERQFDLWGVRDWDCNCQNKRLRTPKYQAEPVEARTVYLRFCRPDGQEIRLAYYAQDRAVDNVAVLRLAIEAMRLNDKRGISDLMRQAYSQLPPPRTDDSSPLPGATDPWEVLGIPGARGRVALAEDQYKRLIKTAHPDAGGSEDEARRLNAAIAAIRATYAA